MSTPAPLTATQLDALPPGSAVRCATERGRTFLALKIDQGTGRHNPSRWNTSDGPATTTNVAAHNPVHLMPATDTAEESGQTITTATAPEHMTMWWDETLWLPFVESESCDITGPGHQNPKAFARLVDQYDATAQGIHRLPKGNRTHPHDVDHRWIVATLDAGGEWTCRAVPAGTPGAIPVTTIWGAR